MEKAGVSPQTLDFKDKLLQRRTFALPAITEDDELQAPQRRRTDRRAEVVFESLGKLGPKSIKFPRERITGLVQSQLLVLRHTVFK